MSLRTFSQLQEEVFGRLKEESDDSGFWTIQNVKDAINNAYVMIANETFCFKLKAIIPIVAEIRTYKLPSNYIIGSLRRVEFDEKIIYPISSTELDQLNRSWKSESASIIRNYIPPGDICKTDEISVYPKPDTDGPVYITATTSKNHGVVVATGDDSYDEFSEVNGVIVGTDGEVVFKGQELGPVIDLYDPTDNLAVYAARTPKRLYNNDEVFLHPVSDNPEDILTKGALSILFTKEGQGKDIVKASYFNKRFTELFSMFNRSKSVKTHRMRSITEISVGNYSVNRGLNIGEYYPTYYKSR